MQDGDPNTGQPDEKGKIRKRCVEIEKASLLEPIDFFGVLP